MNELNLRPTFYRPRGLSEVRSGWRAETTGDVFTHNGTGFELVVGAKLALQPGTRVRFHRSLDLHPTDYIEADERGIVSHVEAETGTVSVLLEGVHNGLGGNTLALTPHDDDEAVSALETYKPRMSLGARVQREPSETAWGIAAGLATLLVTVPLSLTLHEFMPERMPALFFIVGVAWVAVAIGKRAALVLAAVTPFVYNVLIIPPSHTLTPFTAWEWVLVATYLVSALIFPSAPRAFERLKALGARKLA